MLLAAGLLSASLCGCGSVVGSAARLVPTPTPAPTATLEVGFAVAVTPVSAPAASPTPRPTATRFAIPGGPYLQLLPASGPPRSSTVVVRGGHLPTHAQVQLEWAAAGSKGPITTTTWANGRGRLVTRFSIPGSAPGRYRIIASVNGVQYATAQYTVVSDAALSVGVGPSRRGEVLSVRGHHFLSRARLLLIAYPLDVKARPIVVGRARASAAGTFRYRGVLRHLAPGQYALRAWSQNALSAQMAETFFQVVI
jgi:hypothetical protein